MQFTLGVAMQVLSGPNSAQRLGPLLRARGIARVLLVTGETTARLGLYRALRAALAEAGVSAILAQRPPRLPLMEDVEAVAALLREDGVQAIVGVGGGSVLDLAKVAAIVAAEGSPAERHAVSFVPPDVVRYPTLRAPKLPVVAVPTTFSGSEGNGSGHIRGGVERYARSFRDDAVLPSIVVLDPSAGAGQASAQAVSSALNGLAHCVDALFSRERSPFSDALAAQGTRLFLTALPALAADPAHPAARVETQWASLLGGLCIRHAYVGFHHALAHAVVNVAGVPHAVANAVLLPFTIAWRVEREQTQGTHALGVLPPGWDATLRDAAGTAGLPARLREAGVAPPLLPRIASEAMHERMMANEAQGIDEAGLLQVLERAF